MEQFLTKLNIVKKNNYINKLEHVNRKNEERIERYVANFKQEITNKELEKREYLKTIEKLQNENKSYKFILSKIPNWIIKLFAGSKNVGGYLNGKK